MTNRLIASALLSVLLASCATTPQATPPTAAADKRPPPGCVSDTATRLPVAADACAGVGSTYTKEDLDRTGQIYTQNALRMLDPSVTTHP